MNVYRFHDRREAGQRLAQRLDAYTDQPDVLVLGLPRGGVPVAYEVTQRLRAPLDVFVVRKLGVPGHPELALGAIASGGLIVLNHDVVRALRLDDEVVSAVAADEYAELKRREAAYRGERPPLEVRDRRVILVDDGLATGATMRAAVAVIEAQGPARLIVAVPVASMAACDALRAEVDEMVCLMTPPDFRAVGLWYRDFSQTTDDEVRRLLAKAEG